MKCPSCKTPDLLMTERQGIEIDYCPQCRGVWLDRGELDKFIQQAERQAAAPSARSVWWLLRGTRKILITAKVIRTIAGPITRNATTTIATRVAITRMRTVTSTTAKNASPFGVNCSTLIKRPMSRLGLDGTSRCMVNVYCCAVVIVRQSLCGWVAPSLVRVRAQTLVRALFWAGANHRTAVDTTAFGD